MKIVYIGPFSDGELFDGAAKQSYPFKRGISTSVPDNFGSKVLAEQGDPPSWVDEGNPLADESAEQAARAARDLTYDSETGKN
jgi:hypothetical protein